MKVVYTKEQKQTAIKTYKKLKSYEKTLGVLGYPSRHVLYDWVNKRDHKNPNSNPHRTPKRYTWQQKYEVITLVKAGHNIHEVAENKNITSANHIYK